MKIAIAGAGMSGAYLYRLLVNEGFKEVDLYDQKKSTACGSRPCAWGFAPAPETRRLVSRVAGEPSRFELHHSQDVLFDDILIKSDLLTLNKPALIQELVSGAEVRDGRIDLEKYDRVIDATGVERAYLPPLSNDLIAETIQYRMRSEKPLGFWFRTSDVGYEWCFPIGGDEYHVGFGNLKSSIKSYRPLSEFGDKDLEVKAKCRCTSRVRLASPYHSQPLVDGKVVGIGESIGTVAPLAADGNLYAMQTAEMLLENWDDPLAYAEKVLKRYDWMRKERSGMEKLVAGRLPSVSEVLVMKKHSNAVGVEMKTTHVLTLLGHMLQGRPHAPKNPRE